jgi:hypothetical protein
MENLQLFNLQQHEFRPENHSQITNSTEIKKHEHIDECAKYLLEQERKENIRNKTSKYFDRINMILNSYSEFANEEK